MKNYTRNYNKAIYSEDDIRSAIAAYAPIAVIRHNGDARYHICTFMPNDGDGERIADEFDNYLIELFNAR